MPDATPRPRAPLAVACLRGAAAGLALAALLHWVPLLALGNFREVVPGHLYRSGQLGQRRLEEALRRHGIRTVVNLRGPCPSGAWYQAEAEVVARCGASLEDIPMSAMRLPATVSIAKLVEVLDRAEGPLLLHCQQGADRTGLAVVVYLLLRTELTLREARRHLGLETGHVAAGRTAKMGRFFDLYQEWLAARGEGHTPARFRAWATGHYCPDLGRARLEWLTPSEAPGPLGRARAHNTSLRPWRFAPGPNAGVGLDWGLYDANRRLVRGGRVGLFEAVVEPGGHIDLDVPLGRLPPGRYELALDLTDGARATFLQLGNDLFTVELNVP